MYECLYLEVSVNMSLFNEAVNQPCGFFLVRFTQDFVINNLKGAVKEIGITAYFQRKQKAIIKRERMKKYSFSHRVIQSVMTRKREKHFIPKCCLLPHFFYPVSLKNRKERGIKFLLLISAFCNKLCFSGEEKYSYAGRIR